MLFSFPWHRSASGNGVSPSPLAVIGSLLGFLVFNVFPARVFMGDTGSLALGGFVSGMACFLRLPLFLPLVGFIYMMEILSVILQVSFFKLTKGKRIFKMTPIHHHFELMGWSETQVCDGVCYNHSDIMPDRIDGALKYGGNQT